ncbi:MAG: hypothetical protein CMC55_04460 [Flavobacteriaceae bacterium]|uniref:hypothetical protein n=1 Tax=Bizionia echini TaxID=649333 RepID=UPI000C8C7418|nr:hypothetical protein [Flavobacteriaceae bacterium]|tara:strand:+ start:152 stop:343 length:192 start_codon:yes stop_codon:yes gene_type:complete
MYFLYFDPSMGAMIVQAIVATIAGVILFSKNLIFKIKTFLGLNKHQDDFYEDINIDDSDVDKK